MTDLSLKEKCIEAVIKDGMDLHLTIKKFKLPIKARTPEYQRLYRQVVKIQTENKRKKSECVVHYRYFQVVQCVAIVFFYFISGKRLQDRVKLLSQKQDNVFSLKREANNAKIEAKAAQRSMLKLEKRAQANAKNYRGCSLSCVLLLFLHVLSAQSNF